MSLRRLVLAALVTGLGAAIVPGPAGAAVMPVAPLTTDAQAPAAQSAPAAQTRLAGGRHYRRGFRHGYRHGYRRHHGYGRGYRHGYRKGFRHGFRRGHHPGPRRHYRGRHGGGFIAVPGFAFGFRVY